MFVIKNPKTVIEKSVFWDNNAGGNS